MPGMEVTQTWTPTEICAVSGADYLSLPCTIEEGQDLDKGQVIGKRPTTEKFIAYDKDAAAEATVAVAGESNVGDGTFSTVEVQDDYTLTEDWEVTCTAESENAGTFSVVGSVSGDVGDATVGVEFKYPNTSAYMIKFTISNGSEDFDEDDVFTFSTTAAGAREALGILAKDTDASDGDEISARYQKGVFYLDKLTGLDDAAKEALNAKVDGNLLII